MSDSLIKTKISGDQILDGSVNRQNLDTAILQDIDTLIANDQIKASDIAQLEQDLSSESATRASEDSAIGLRIDGVQDDISNEISLRMSGDNALQNNIDAEAANREAADVALSTRLNTLEQDPTTKTYVDEKVAELVNSAPEVLDTLKELADAIGDDPNFVTTVASQIGSVSANLSAEVSAREAADLALQGNIDLVVSDLEALDTRVDQLDDSAFVTREIPVGIIDGVNTIFSLAATPNPGTEQVFLNGIMQESGESGDYTISGSTITFNVAPVQPYTLFVNYIIGNLVVSSDSEGVAAEISSLQGSINNLQSTDQSLNVRITALENQPDPVLDINGLSDVVISSPTLNQVLQFDGVKWINGETPNAFGGSYNDLTQKPDLSVFALESVTSAQISDVVTSLSSEISRAQAAENTLAADLSTEVLRAQGVEINLDSRVSTLESVVPFSGSYNDLTDKLPYASASVDGLVSTSAQTIAGSKTFTSEGWLSGIFQTTGNLNTNVLALSHPSSSANMYLNFVTGTAPDGPFTVRSYISYLGAYNWAEWATSDGTNQHYSVRISTAPSTLGRIGINTTDFAAQLTVASTSATTIPLRVQASASQSADICRMAINDGSSGISVTNLGTLYAHKGAYVYARATGSTALNVYGLAGQVGNLLSLRDSNNNIVFGISASGAVNAGTVPTSRISGLATVATSGSYNDLSNKPSIPSITGLATESYVNTKVADLVNNAPAVLDTLNELAAALGNDANFATTVAGQIGDIAADVSALDTRVGVTEGDISTLQTEKADISSLAAVATSGSYTDLTDKPSLFSGSYTDLTEKPSLFDGAYSSLTGAPSLATVATSGSYVDLTNKPTIPAALDDLSDVTIASPIADQVIKYNGTAWINAAAPAAGATDLDGLSDVVITSAAKGQFVVHNGTNFVNSNTIEASGAAIKPLVLKGAESQTANLFEAQNSSGTALASISSAGTVHATRYTETIANAFNTSLAPSSGTLTVDTSTGNAVLGALSAAVTTWAFTNVPTDNSKVTTITAVIAGNASYTYGDACSVNGSAVSGGIMWSGGSAPTATANTDVITFIIVKDSAGTVKVLGSATTNFS